jgi:quinol---cytochrome c reductase iron-sulfur subunit, bacillus type
MDDDYSSVTRRRLLGAGAQVTGALAAAAFTVPALAFVIGPALESEPERWEAVGAPADFTSDIFRSRVITLEPGAGEAGKGLVYVRRRTDDDRDTRDEFVALTSRCSHVGCPVKYVQAAQSFVCPCHGGVYGFRGQRTGGPPPRPLDRFRTRVRAGRVEVGPRFSLDSELRPHAPHHPGESLDGIGPIVYP